MISVIIPTYKSPEVLDLCLKSAIEGQVNKNQIIVVVDGFYDVNKEVYFIGTVIYLRSLCISKLVY